MDHRIRENFKRSWCAQCRYDGLQEFIFGTVFADNEHFDHYGMITWGMLRRLDAALEELTNARHS